MVRMMPPLSYVLVPSPFGNLSILWRKVAEGPRVYRLLLPDEQALLHDPAQVVLLGASSGLPRAIVGLGERAQRFLEGDAVKFRKRDLNLLALDTCTEFQQRVLLAEYGIPKGRVSTYGRIAKHLGVPRGARAVGNALARNPFPIVIPCHRAVRSNGQLGGYRGGVEMKQALLEMEGVKISPEGKVLTDRFYY
jgi:methylated-DNA-[protein]-cysteine S-methyltransferase